MRLSVTLLMGVMAVAAACVTCTPPDEGVYHMDAEPTEFRIQGTQEFQTQDGGSIYLEDSLTDTMLIASVNGLATGTYYIGQDKILEQWLVTQIGIWYYDTTLWIGPLQISKTGGSGSCDSTTFTTTYQTLSGYPGFQTYFLKHAILGRSGGMICAEDIYTGTSIGGLDTAQGGDNVRVIWTLYANALVSASDAFITDTLLWKVAYGWRWATSCPYIYRMVFIFKQAPTNDTCPVTYELTSGTGWACETFTNTDAEQRTIANDTLFEVRLISNDGYIVARDTLDRAVPINKRPEFTWPIHGYRWP